MNVIGKLLNSKTIAVRLKGDDLFRLKVIEQITGKSRSECLRRCCNKLYANTMHRLIDK